MNSVQKPGDDQKPPRNAEVTGNETYLFGEFALGAVVGVFAFLDQTCGGFEKRLARSVAVLAHEQYIVIGVYGRDDDGIGMVNDLTDGLRAASH